jgi:hypothetical protein
MILIQHDHDEESLVLEAERNHCKEREQEEDKEQEEADVNKSPPTSFFRQYTSITDDTMLTSIDEEDNDFCIRESDQKNDDLSFSLSKSIQVLFSSTTDTTSSDRQNFVSSLSSSAFLSKVFSIQDSTRDHGCDDEASTVQRISPFCKKWRNTTVTLMFFIVGWTSLFIMGKNGWPGKDVPLNCFEEYLTNPECMCEKPRPNSIIAQPVNTFSNLSYAVGGIFIAWCSDTQSFPSRLWWENVNLITQVNYFSLTYSIVLTNVSYCSGFFHAGWIQWGGIFDVLAMITIMLWIELYIIIKLFCVVYRTRDRSISMKLATILHVMTLIIMVTIVYIIWFVIDIPTMLTDCILYSFSLAIIIELWLLWQKYIKKMKQLVQVEWIGVLSLLLFMIGFITQQLTKSGSKFCSPESFLQGHAVWHFLSGLASTNLYFFFLSEKFMFQ